MSAGDRDTREFDKFKAERLKDPEIKAAYDAARQATTLASLLAEHQIGVADGGTAYASRCPCSCGEKNEIRNGTRQQARRKALAHVADVLLASDWLREQRAEAWDEGAGFGHKFGKPEKWENPYRTTENTEESTTWTCSTATCTTPRTDHD